MHTRSKRIYPNNKMANRPISMRLTLEGQKALHGMLYTFLSQRDFRCLWMSQSVPTRRGLRNLIRTKVSRHKYNKRQEITHPVAWCHRKIKSGEGEIRTPGPLRDAGFQDRCNRPLCHLSGCQIFTGSINEPEKTMVLCGVSYIYRSGSTR